MDSCAAAVAAVARDSCAAAVARDSSAATKCLPFEFADDAFFLKQAVQNFARGEAASFLQPGLLHFFFAFFAMAPPGKLKTSTSNLNINGNGVMYVHNYILV